MRAFLYAFTIILATQGLEVLLIASNQGTNPLLFILPLDVAMLGGLLWSAERV